MTTETNFTLREVTDDDREFLLSVYAEARAMELSLVPWDDAMKRAFVEHQFNAQSDHYREHYRKAVHSIIVVNGEDAGRVYVDREGADTISLLDITVLPQYRGQGVGKAVIEGLLEEGRNSGRSVCVYTEDFNPSVRLFERLGFEVKEKDGFLLRLEASPAEK